MVQKLLELVNKTNRSLGDLCFILGCNTAFLWNMNTLFEFINLGGTDWYLMGVTTRLKLSIKIFSVIITKGNTDVSCIHFEKNSCPVSVSCPE